MLTIESDERYESVRREVEHMRNVRARHLDTIRRLQGRIASAELMIRAMEVEMKKYAERRARETR